ncbi:MAG: twin-arginine translocation pathway signal [Maritimibacter sp.]|uniref:lipid-binding SYLF domain-containing protein n=1 Tax=Maritimibacter sp. TaxID=2003363 RepID=UPI001D541127|nr:YSC84-related protein [Maritimibacter sp.]MBL6429718.1 twin-arginine translocation pathway signal [Maritimibacter sp.]
MKTYTRRGVLMAAGGAGASLALAGCDNGMGSNAAGTIDARVDSTLNYLFSTYPEAQDLRSKSVGMLVMPLVTEAGILVGGAYGRGALRVGGATVDYYSQTKASLGIQVGAQQYAHVLFFMTEDALGEFRYSPGWVAGADIKYAVLNEGDRFSADTLAGTTPVVAMVFGTAGLIVGATVEGSKYTRIIP